MSTSPAQEAGRAAEEGLARYLVSWHPEPVVDHDDLDAAPTAALSAVLDLPQPAAGPGDTLPLLWHWLHFLEWPPQRELGEDGHPLHGHFLPPLPDRRRMFAGGRLRVQEPLRLGTPAWRRSSLHRVETKHGRSGEMVFVTTRHEFGQGDRSCLVEEQDIVYRCEDRAPSRPVPPDPDAALPREAADWSVPMRPDSRMLFRISALTANSHRIHYDAPYAEQREGYPGLVVHGPLLALLMAESLRRNAQARPTSFDYRLRSPIFTGEELRAVRDGERGDGGRVRLRVETARESRHATAAAGWA
ncbi:hypothetical protein [Streptomyces sulphureus]|uniref:hypothetical protein n=1 Tax=Streptomyces sulphureus TaxID=47758 RepID=UPI00035DEBB2|nr:hypothetical protein [Streptomyces sulphureus]